MTRPIDPRAAAIRAYTKNALQLREQARIARQDGYGEWFYELIGFAVIAERAAKAEMVNRPPQFVP